MDNLENKEVQANEEIEKEVTQEVNEEDLKEGKNMYDHAMGNILSMGLNWTFRSIDYLVNRENITMNQLRSCVYKKGDEVIYDVYRSCVYILASGLVNPKTITKDDYEKLIDTCKDTVEEWREGFGNIGVLQIMLINLMQVKHHFFINKQDVKVLDYMSSENLQKDLVMNTIAMDMQLKIAQSQAIQS